MTSRHQIFNPFTEAARDLEGIEKIGGKRGNWNLRGFCWDCRLDKPRLGGKVYGGARLGQPTRFRCAECIEAKKNAA